MAAVAARCLQYKRESRPEMNIVVRDLSSLLDSEWRSRHPCIVVSACHC